jgi:DNA-binding MarR family transcriptional regulator
VSRYVSWQLKQGLVKETIDPDDRRQRRLVQTKKGRKEWLWQVDQLGNLFAEIKGLDSALDERNAKELLARMIELTDMAPKRIR